MSVIHQPCGNAILGEPLHALLGLTRRGKTGVPVPMFFCVSTILHAHLTGKAPWSADCHQLGFRERTC